MWKLLLGWVIFCIIALTLWHFCCVREVDFSSWRRKIREKKRRRRKGMGRRPVNRAWINSISRSVHFAGEGNFVDLERGQRHKGPERHQGSGKGPPVGWRRPFPPSPASSASSHTNENENSPSRSFNSATRTPPTPLSPPSPLPQGRKPHVERVDFRSETFQMPKNEKKREHSSSPSPLYIRLFSRDDQNRVSALERPLFAHGREAPPKTPVILFDEFCTIWKNGDRQVNHQKETKVYVQPGTSIEGVILVQNIHDFYYMHSEFEPDDCEEIPVGGIMKEELMKLPCDSVRSGIKMANKECLICLEPFHMGEPVTQSDCSILFHRDCIWKWLEQCRTCPKCGSIVDPKKWDYC